METPYGRFSADFCVDRLSNLCDPNTGIQTGPFGSQLHQEDYVQIGTPIITVEHLGENRILHVNTPKVSDFDRDRLSRYQLNKGDIVFSRVGSVDRRALVREKEEGWLFSGRCLRVRPDPAKIDPQYLSYFFGLSAFKKHIRSIAVGATMPSLNTSLLSEIVVPHPPNIEEQRAIAHILGTLDDKIELLRKQNETLEAMARALFKAWFVDFEPVRAKMEGRWRRGESLPGLPAHLYDIFPDHLVESELGEIPEGWELASLTEFSSLNPEAWTKRTRPEQIRYVDLSNTKWGRIESVTNYDADDAPSRAQRVLRPLDTIVGTVRPGNGSYALISDDGLTASTGFAVLRPLRRECAEFVYLAATARENIERLSNLADGGAYPAVRPEIVSATQVPRAGEKLINEFSRQVSSMLAGIAANERTSRSLAQLRDTLLPKLISGELRVPDAERILREAEKA
jgi:type I restriction enzyme S subunit